MLKDDNHNKILTYDIRDEDLGFIKAAKKMGSWLLERSEIAPPQALAINKVLFFLNNLPNQPEPNFNGDFGFEIYSSDDINSDRIGAWSIGFCKTDFEVYSDESLADPEFFWFLCPGTKNDNNLYGVEKWIEQVSDPIKLLKSDNRFIINAGIYSE